MVFVFVNYKILMIIIELKPNIFMDVLFIL